MAMFQYLQVVGRAKVCLLQSLGGAAQPEIFGRSPGLVQEQLRKLWTQFCSRHGALVLVRPLPKDHRPYSQCTHLLTSGNQL